MLDLIGNEDEVLKYWSEHKTLDKVREMNQGKKVFFFLEGPPYANGELHMGHMRGYTRKDAILRYKRSLGYDVYDRSGFDVHGLPIENKVEKTLNLKSKKDIENEIGVGNFIDQCISLYEENVRGQINVARKYGIWLDFENPYIPASAFYIDKAWEVFKKIHEKGLVYKDLRVMPYCIHCGTALAKGPEVEEEEDTDPSVFVLFKVDAKTSNPKINIPADTYFLVWTTTPWTLPANMSIAVNPKALYVLASMDGKNIILAKQRVDALGSIVGASIIITEQFYGSELKDIHYINPLEKFVQKQADNWKFHKVLLSEEAVNLEDGTGILHVAPSYGPEDFELAKKNNIPAMSIVELDGSYNELAGKYRGLKVIHEANREIEKDLKSIGALVAKTSIRHNYPHCWRCKEKLVYLPTEQWFINIGKIKNRIIKESEKVDWHPEELKKWFISSIEQSPDWVISRQRYWGIPIPLWICDKCKKTRAVGSFKELKEHYPEIEFDSKALHKPSIDDVVLKCDKCNSNMHRAKDVFDVWYDSGVAHSATIPEEKFKSMYSHAFITEGPDQIRGWFATLMKTGVAAYGKAPFKTVLMQGWVLDEKGEAMHKSKGNYISAHELVGKYSMDATRAFMLSRLTYENLKFSKRDIGEMQQVIGTLYNVSNLIHEYSQAVGYLPKKIKRFKESKLLEKEDAWILSRFNSTIRQVGESLDNYEVYNAINSLTHFLVNDFSRFYLKIAKKRILDGDKKSVKVKIDLVSYIMHDLLIILAPFMPLAAEKLYLDNYGVGRMLGIRQESIFMERWPKFNLNTIDTDLESDFEIANETITALLNDRERVKIKLRWPLLKASVEVSDDAISTSLQKLSSLIGDYTNIKSIEVKTVSGMDEEIRPLFGKLGPDFKDRAPQVAQALKTADAKKVREEIEKNGHYTLHMQSGPVNITENHFTFIKKANDDDALVFKYGKVMVDPHINEELRKEAIMREFERRIQMLRKTMGLRKVDKIEIGYQASQYLDGLILENVEKIKKNINAKAIAGQIKDAVITEDLDIEGETLKIHIEKVG